MTIEVFENPDKSLTIMWDKTDPVESQLNSWTEEDFIHTIMERVKDCEIRDKC